MEEKKKILHHHHPQVSIAHPVLFGVVSVAVKRYDTMLARDCPDGSWQRRIR
ncbi:hypothetical protein CSPX01_05884 [Colletotrichum filicis]|nr:hypothetical protein CSPX01_05884 [Colletotrichum filicis]